MKPVSVLVLALLFSSSLYASNYGYLSMCIDKYVPNSSTQKQIYHFKVDDEKSQCMHYGKYAEFTVEIPPHAKPRLYCADHEEAIATETVMHFCGVKNSYLGFSLTGEGGGASAKTSGQLHFYGPPDHNEAYFTDDVDTSLHLCLGKGNCGGQEVKYHNGDHIYIIYDGDG